MKLKFMTPLTLSKSEIHVSDTNDCMSKSEIHVFLALLAIQKKSEIHVSNRNYQISDTTEYE